ncbi:hypothetical protein [Bradyrhizobium sp. WSM3983]|uniref:hypothetical protein n=1 Tax=Bradyrhizobium sp. WSM3983 TaxID=1038867 RepID=UPI000411C424|nr:hypothetical protein [Bradyrhizobium sp. WSM3983]
MIDAKLAQLRAHRQNVNRYRRLLGTKLSPLERQYIERRLSEESAAIDTLAASTFPITFSDPRREAPHPVEMSA